MPKMIDLKQAIVVSPPNTVDTEAKAIQVLLEEVEKRTLVRWATANIWPSEDTPLIVIGTSSALIEAFENQIGAAVHPNEDGAAEGYRIRIARSDENPVLYVIGNDARGVLFGVGHLLRTLRMDEGRIHLPSSFEADTAPAYPLRGHQLGYRDKTNSYCAWDTNLWDQYIRDLVIFGTNAIELIPPRSDDNLTSVQFPRPPLDMMERMSEIADSYGMDVWIWYPAMDEDYSDPETVTFALQEWAEVFERLPRIDAIFVPGGDPGRTRPKYLMPMLEKQAASLKRFHPTAELWISPQGFSDAWMDEFLGILEKEPEWLDGVVFGPWIHMPTEEFREIVPAKYPIRHYPDITHTFSCQYPVPDWDVAYALTEGREIINPRPEDQALIFRQTQEPTIGFLTYSEGCHDDVNKFIWSALGWDPDRDIIDILREYSRYFIGERYTDDFAQGLLSLERNWRGPLAENEGVYVTLEQFKAMEDEASPHLLRNWRFQQPLYRAYYDAYVRSRLLYERGLEAQALGELRQAPRLGSMLAMQEAERIFDKATVRDVSRDWRIRIFQLAEALFQSIRMQLSVDLYQGQREVRGANLDGLDFPLNNGPWLKAQFKEIRALAKEKDRLQRIQDLVDWTNPGPGGFYENLGTSYRRPHIVEGLGYDKDPGFWKTPFRQYAYHSKALAPLPLAWYGYFGALKDTPLEMRYSDLDPEAQYKLRIVYSTQDPQTKIRLEAANGVEIHPWMLKKVPPEPIECKVPPQAIEAGELYLRWHREPGRGGAGRGCEISEIWIIKS